ncbi:MAG TPA: energy-coupling factor ABC transporter permease [Acidimicrobiales bacterium]|nr:energy-coupling factor ABC transporter permease [Acidimicrobiales bacterium]
MHIPDGWIDLPTSAAAGTVAVGAVAVAARRAGAALRSRATSLPAVMSAYVLVAQLLVVPVGWGTSAHLVGSGLAALLVGPAVAVLCGAVVVVLQALVLADGGVTALGLNLLNDGAVPALVTYGAFVALRPLLRARRARAVAGGLCAGLGAFAGAAAAAAEFAVGGTDTVPPGTVAASIGGAHVLVAALEAVLTALALATVLRLRPDLVRATAPGRRVAPAVAPPVVAPPVVAPPVAPSPAAPPVAPRPPAVAGSPPGRGPSPSPSPGEPEAGLPHHPGGRTR